MARTRPGQQRQSLPTVISEEEYNQYILPLEKTGFWGDGDQVPYDDAALARIVAGYTNRTFSIISARDYLRSKGLWSQRQDLTMRGKFAVAYESGGLDQETRDQMDEFWSIIFAVEGINSGTVLWVDEDGDIREKQPAGEQRVMWDTLAAGGHITNKDRGEYFKQGARLVWPNGVADTDVANARANSIATEEERVANETLASHRINAEAYAADNQSIDNDDATNRQIWIDGWDNTTGAS